MSATAPRRDPVQLLDRLVEAIGTEQARLVSHPDPRNAELAPPPELLDAIKAVRAGIGELQQTIDVAWGVIANAGDGDWSLLSAEWQAAAVAWRDERYLSAGDSPKSERDRKLDAILAALATVSNLARELWGPEAVSMTLNTDAALPEHGGRELADRIGHTSSAVKLERKRDVHLDAKGRAIGDVGAELDGGPANG